MKITELIDILEDLKHEVGDDAEVRFASQPTYPFEYSIREVHALSKYQRLYMAQDAMREEGMTEEEIEENLDRESIENSENVVYLEEGCQIGYLPGEAKDYIGW